MRPSAAAAGSPFTWALALVFVVLIDAAITRSPILWARMSGEDSLDVRLAQLGQTYQAARKIYAPEREAKVRVALLGDSRIWFPARQPYVERELQRVAPELDVRVDNLGIFGALMGDLEVLSRHFERLDPTLVVLAIGGLEMLPRPSGRLGTWPSRILNIGWCDGPLAPRSQTERLDRWVRTLWPLYRFRIFARLAIEDRIVPGPISRPFPDRFVSTRDFHAFMHGKDSAAVDAIYQAWRTNPTLAGFVDYLERKRRGVRREVNRIAPPGASLNAHSTGVRVLERLLARLAERGTPTLILLMPENPLLDLDVSGQYHEPGFSDQAAEIIRNVAERYDVPVVDGRRWMPAESFLDFAHLMPDVSGFQTPLAEEIVRAVGS